MPIQMLNIQMCIQMLLYLLTNLTYDIHHESCNRLKKNNKKLGETINNILSRTH